MQQGGEVVYCTGFDSYFTEAEGCIEGGLQEEEAFASWPASQEDQSYQEKADKAPGNFTHFCAFVVFSSFSNLRFNALQGACAMLKLLGSYMIFFEFWF